MPPDAEPQTDPIAKQGVEPEQARPTVDDDALARALAARGVPQDEVQRLLSLGKHQPEPAVAQAQVLEDPACPIPGPQFRPKPSISFPEFRKPAQDEADEAERLLREAALSRRRGRFAEAAEKCSTAIQKAPRDAAGLELYGDVLQALGRVDDALAAYRRAGEADPRRKSAEKKYAQLLLMQDRSVAAFQGQAEATSPYLAVLLSALCPGAGQYYNGQTGKALVLAAGALVLLVALLWTPLGFPGSAGALTPSTAFLMTCLGVVYIFGLVDANISARTPRRRRSGWDV